MGLGREGGAKAVERGVRSSIAAVGDAEPFAPERLVVAYKNPALENGLTAAMRYNAAAEMLNRVLFAYAAECRESV